MEMRSFRRITTTALLLLALVPLIGSADNKSVGPKKAKDVKLQQGPDLTVLPTMISGANCTNPDCNQCPSQTGQIWIKNSGNKASLSEITITVKRNEQLLHTWTAPALAPGAARVVGSVTTFMSFCNPPPLPGSYFFTVDTQKVVAETNEGNNTVVGVYNTRPQKTTFQ